MEEREQEEVQIPEDAVEDLDPSGEDSQDVKGGTSNWWKKTETTGTDG